MRRIHTAGLALAAVYLLVSLLPADEARPVYAGLGAYIAPGPDVTALRPVTGTILYTPEGEVAGFLQIDLLSLGREERSGRQVRRAEVRTRRQGMSVLEVAGDHAREQWPWYAGTVAALVAVDQAARNNSWLWHRGSGSSAPRPPVNVTGVSITGDGATITQIIVLRQPQDGVVPEE